MKRWAEITPDPNSLQAKAFRLDTLRRAYALPVVSRIPYLAKLAGGKRVLDVGVVEHTAVHETKQDWLHREIAKSAAYCLGVDVLEADIKILQTTGYNVQVCDITREDPGDRFELIVIGEVIEHVGSPEEFFHAAKRLLVPGGRLVITTPNAYYWKQIRNQIRRHKSRCESVDHVTLLFPSGMAEMAERSGLVLDTYRGVFTHEGRPPVAGAALAIRHLVGSTLAASELFCETIIYECVNVVK